MTAMASQITGVSIVCSTVGSGVDQRRLQNSASLAFVWGIHRWPVNSPHKRPVTRKMFPFNDLIMFMPPVTQRPRMTHSWRRLTTDNIANSRTAFIFVKIVEYIYIVFLCVNWLNVFRFLIWDNENMHKNHICTVYENLYQTFWYKFC